jgi:hAT family C-terminal dimerisation region
MSSSTKYFLPIPSEGSSTPSSAPATALLESVEQELGLQPPARESEAPIITEVPKAARQFQQSGTSYIELLVQDTRRKPRSAWYWQHGSEFEAQNKAGGHKLKESRVWVCNHCPRLGTSRYTINGSAHINEHLRKAHSLNEGKLAAPRISIAESLRKYTPKATEDLDLAEADRKAILHTRFREALVAFICCVHIAFSIVESEWFLALLTTLSDLVPALLPASHNTVRNWVVKSYEQRKQKVIKQLQNARSNIHLSFDLWTSPNHHAFNAIVAHYVTSEYKVVSTLLAFRNLLGPHSGENIAGSVQDVCEEYQISPRLGCFVLDNATNNDTCITVLGAVYNWTPKQQEQRRLRCMGHIINLVAQAFVLGEKAELFEQAITAAEMGRDEEVQLWQLCGPIGKLHYIVVYILRTPQRRQQFKVAAGGECEPTELMPKRDNSTRWNSIYRMIVRALQLRQQLNLFCHYTAKDDLREAMRLDEDDWFILTHLASAMKCFEDATKALEGHATDTEYGSMSESIPVIEKLQSKLIELQLQNPLSNTFPSTVLDTLPPEALPIESSDQPGANPASGFITECTNRAFTKLAEYYGKTGDSIWYTAGLILNPTIKWKYLKYHWKDKPDWLDTAKLEMKKLWAQYRPTTPAKANARKRTLPHRGPQPAKSIRREDNYRDDALYSWRQQAHEGPDSSDEEPQLDEYEQYCGEKVLPDSEVSCQLILDYWRRNSTRWPHLSKLAFDSLSIPAMSSECERCFSSGGNLIGDDRYSLAPATIEACECNRHWLLHKVG